MRRHPLIYEINTWPWLASLTGGGRRVTLKSVPAAEWDRIAALGVDAVWLMGVWTRSPAGRAVAAADHDLQRSFHAALPDYVSADNVGSAYCVRDYVVDPHLGGYDGLARTRQALARRGIALILDFVPNHVAIDHPWAIAHPDYFIQAGDNDEDDDSVTVGATRLCNGRDPSFPPWRDVLQLNAFSSPLRAAAAATLETIATMCDGVRCDMAMLLLNEVFAETWKERAGNAPLQEYWQEVIVAVRKKTPHFFFVAEAYWDLEPQLLQAGFDLCYDKALYDRLVRENAATVTEHLKASAAHQEGLLRFIENHDEDRAATMFGPQRERAAATAILTLPGGRLLYDGQTDGRKVRLPVFLGRQPSEPLNAGLRDYYQALLKELNAPLYHDGCWSLCPVSGWSDNQTCRNLLAWSWSLEDQHALIVVNDSAEPAQGLVHDSWTGLHSRIWQLHDPVNRLVFTRCGDEMSGNGLYVGLGPWAFHFFRLSVTTLSDE